MNIIGRLELHGSLWWSSGGVRWWHRCRGGRSCPAWGTWCDTGWLAAGRGRGGSCWSSSCSRLAGSSWIGWWRGSTGWCCSCWAVSLHGEGWVLPSWGSARSTWQSCIRPLALGFLWPRSMTSCRAKVAPCRDCANFRWRWPDCSASSFRHLWCSWRRLRRSPYWDRLWVSWWRPLDLATSMFRVSLGLHCVLWPYRPPSAFPAGHS